MAIAKSAVRLISAGEVSEAGRYSHPRWGALGSYEPDQVGLSVYDKMRRTDETIKAALQFVKLSAVSKLGTFKHPDPKVQDFVATNFRMMQGTPERVAGDILSAFWAGFSVAELVYDRMPSGPFKGMAYYKKVRTLHPLTVWPKGIHEDGKGNVKEVVQFEGQATPATLPQGKFAHFIYDGGGGAFGSPWGTSALRAVHRWWFAKDLVVKFWGIFMERFSIPLVVAKVPAGPIRCPVDGNEEEYATAMMHILQSWTTKTEMAFPIPTDPDGKFAPDAVQIDFKSPAAPTAIAFEQFIRAADTAILRGLLVPSLVLAEAQFGTRAQASVQLDAFMSMLADLQRDLADFMVEQLIRPLLDLNFASLDDYGQWIPQSLTGEDVAQLSEALFRMFNAGAMDATDKVTQDWVRSKFAPELQEQVAEEEMEPPGGEPTPEQKPPAEGLT